jgi:uncharacterized repeat protein (TIGR03803 family)
MKTLSACKNSCVILLLFAATAISLQAQTYTRLHSFDIADGYAPDAGLVQAADGNLYGTTYQGGANGFGTTFMITPRGTLTTLHTFCSMNLCTDGAYPLGGLVQATDGNLYGTTTAGGQSYGTVFRITLTGTLTTLHKFAGLPTEGSSPSASLVQATDGSFYGTTSGGGTYGYGTVFKITRSGVLTTLHNFCSENLCSDGQNPYASLVQFTNGNLYGTTYSGGANGFGTIFMITTKGRLTTLHSFTDEDGANPYAGLVQATDGNFYGTTYGGGAESDGTVFKITPDGILTTLHSFVGGPTDAANPYAGLIEATDGNFYGTTDGGGTETYGTVFEITSSGAVTILHSFCSQRGCADGQGSEAALVQDTNGTFYGATPEGGAMGYGTVFSLSDGLGEFVETLPTSGKVASTVGILGTQLTGATNVTFNGTAAVFKVISNSLITATVPAGATTGKIQVATPGGTLTSNIPFRVMH